MVRRIYSFNNYAKTYLLLLLLPLDLVWVAAENGIEPRSSEIDENVLQKHVAFFDRNHDSLIYPWETFEGFRAIGCGVTLSTVASIFINLALSHKTRSVNGKFRSPLFPIEVKNIQRGKHGSDTGVFDSDGRFVPLKFEEIFSKHAHKHSEALTSDELMELLKSNREPKDYSGWVGAWTEWKILYFLCKDRRGLLHKNTIRAVYDGSLFPHMEEETNKSKKREA